MKSMTKELLLLHLTLIDGIGPITIKKIWSNIPDDFEVLDLYRFKVLDVAHMFGLSERVASKIVSGLQNTDKLEKEIHLISKHNIQFVTIACEAYPQLLANIYAPPPVLYFTGENILGYEKKVAFVGSRKAHRYGEKAIENIIPDMVKNGFVIVSGGAIGADSMAHSTTVRSGGKTVAVIGSGLLHPYPHSNRRLFDQIIDSGGALVSPFPLDTVAKPGNFPARNRIIAGLSIGCVVVQAAKKSGASITAQFALDQGREVFAIPGPVDDELSLGCHALIQQGAKLISDAQDILVEFGHVTQSCEVVKQISGKAVAKNMSITDVKQNLKISVKHSNSYEDGTIEYLIMEYCKKPCSIDEISIATDKKINELHEILFEMQLQGNIQQNHAGMFERL